MFYSRLKLGIDITRARAEHVYLFAGQVVLLLIDLMVIDLSVHDITVFSMNSKRDPQQTQTSYISTRQETTQKIKKPLISHLV